jgi:hypothetical protein
MTPHGHGEAINQTTSCGFDIITSQFHRADRVSVPAVRFHATVVTAKNAIVVFNIIINEIESNAMTTPRPVQAVADGNANTRLANATRVLCFENSPAQITSSSSSHR